MNDRTAREVEIFAQGVSHPEGVVFDQDGWLYAGGTLGDYKSPGFIYRISPDGKTVESFADTGGRVLGLAFNRNGQLFVCDSVLGAVFRITPSGQVNLFADRVGERRLQIPNFLVFDKRGLLYVSDSGTATAGERTGAIFRFSPDGHGEVWLDHLIFANGLALAAQGDALFIVETRDDRVLRVLIQADGTAGNIQVFADHLESGPDGLALDLAGNLYVTLTRTNRIARIRPDGTVDAVVTDPSGESMNAPSNVAFGPPEGRGLYIANLFGDYIGRLVIAQKGLPLYHQTQD